MNRMFTALLLPLLVSGCALFQQVPGRVTTPEFTTEAGAVYGKAVSVPGACPSITFGGAQNVGEVAATCEDGGKKQSLTAKSIDANSVLTAAIAGQTALGQQLSAVAQSVIALLGVAKAGATGGVAFQQPAVIQTPGDFGGAVYIQPPGAAVEIPAPPRAPLMKASYTLPMLVCPLGTIITMVNGAPACQ